MYAIEKKSLDSLLKTDTLDLGSLTRVAEHILYKIIRIGLRG